MVGNLPPVLPLAFRLLTKKKLATASTSLIPVTVDVPFATAMIGFRPAKLPPLLPGESGIPIGHVQSNQWAERAGLKVGDIITHVNGQSVAEMKSGEEFIESVSPRPLRLTIQIQVSRSDLSSMLESFDWSQRFKQVDAARKGAKADPAETDELFNRVLGSSLEYDGKSSLFDFSKWLGSRPEAPQPVEEHHDVAESAPAHIQVAISEPSPVASPIPTVPAVPAAPKPPRVREVRTTRSVLKWVPSHPLCVWFKIDRGFFLPDRAGTLGLDYWMQPFNAEPFLELNLIASPAGEITMNEILDSKAIEPTASIQTPICDRNNVWNYSGSLYITNESFAEGDVMLVGKLMDYRRLENPKPMGVFAVKLDQLEVSDNVASVKSGMISLTLVDALTFDVSKTKIRMTICLKGRQVSHTEITRTQLPVAPSETPESSSKTSSPSLISSLSPSGTQTPVETIEKPVVAVAPTKILTPFQRAHQKALRDIKMGDNSPIKSQNYTLR